jgi:hypothetical protein
MGSMNMRFYLCFLVLISFTLCKSSKAQSDTVLLRAYGGVLFEEAAQLIEYSAGGYAMTGTTGSNQSGNSDVFVARFDQDLNCVWSKNFGGSNVEWASSIANDVNGNLLVCGYTLSFGAGGYDMWVIKVNSDGQLIWQMSYGGPDWDFAKQIIAHPNGGFLICGNTYSYGNGGQDGTLLHINDDGVLLNQRFFGGPNNDSMNDIVAVADGYVSCGHETVDNSMKSRIWRFDTNDNLLWERTDGDSQDRDRQGMAISTEGNQICVVGSVTASDSYSSFEQVMQLDNTALLELIDVHDFDYSHLDCAFFDGQVYFTGFRAVWGVELARLVRKRADLLFTGVFEFSGPYLTRFNSVIATSEGLVFSGSYLQNSFQNWQACLLKYTSPNLNAVVGTPQFLPCFSIGVDEETSLELGYEGQLVNAMGQVVSEHFEWDPTLEYQHISPGVYYVRDKTTGSVRRIWFGN